MSITDELRKYAEENECKSYCKLLNHIADRIDAEHQKCIDAMWEDAKSHLSDESLTEQGWIRLPKDAHGEYIHVGDEVEWCDSGETLTVEGIGRDVLFYIDGENAEWTAARNKRHHHEPTVEDVLEELLREYDRDDSELTNGEIIERFAAKLRLAGDE